MYAHACIIPAMTTTSPPPIARDRLDGRAWAALLVLCGALFLDGLDVSMVGMALPSIETELHLSTASLQWVVSGYVLGFGGLLLLGGRAADLLGRRRVFITALSVFAFASLLGGLVDDGTLLVVTRFIKGVAAAFTAPAGLSIITTTFAEGPVRNKALAVYTATGASGFSFGLIMGGALTQLGWRWTFLVPFPIALALAFAASRLIPRDLPQAGERRAYDVPGALAITTAMLALVFTVVRAPDVGWTSAWTLGGAVAAASLLAAFVARERSVDEPLVRLGILRTPGLVPANLGAMTIAGSYFSFQFVTTLYLQQTLGWSSMVTALAFLPGGLIVAVGAPNLGPLIDRFGAHRLLAGGLLAFTAGYALFLRADGGFAYASVLLPTMLLIGSGFALAFPSANVAATSGVADSEQGLASGLVNTSFQIGGAVVLAAVTAIVASGSGAVPSGNGLPDGSLEALVFVTGVAALGAGAVAAGGRRAARAAAKTAVEAT
jgi:MFS family permease